MHKKFVWIVVVLLLLFIAITMVFLGIKPSVKSDSLSTFVLPLGFKIEVYADSLGSSPVAYPGPNPGPRMMLIKDNVLYVTIPNQGRVIALPDRNNDKKADNVVTFLDKLNNPHGIDFDHGWFYIAQENRVIRVKSSDDSLKADPETVWVLDIQVQCLFRESR